MKPADKLTKADLSQLQRVFKEMYTAGGTDVLLDRDSSSDFNTRIWYKVISNSILADRLTLESKLEMTMDFIDRAAGPIGSGCRIGSLQHMAQEVRHAVNLKRDI